MSRRILIISYHFPPSTVAASFRPLRLAKYLPKMGWQVWTLSAAAGSYPAGRVDDGLVGEVPESVGVTRVPNLNPLLWYEARQVAIGDSSSSKGTDGAHTPRRRLGIKSFLAELAKFPDVDAPWAAAALVPAISLVLRHRIDVIYTSGPPFGAHLLGLALKRLTGRPWLAQYGNPWTANPSVSWRFGCFRRRCEKLDRAIVRSADAVLVLDDVLANCIRDLGRTDGVHVHPNGFDPEHFAEVPLPGGKFTITYAGSLYNMHDPGVIYEALDLIGRENPGVRQDMRVVFAGPPCNDPLRAGAPPDVEFPGPLAHSELARALGNSHLLLDFLTSPAERKFTVSCKLYEYIAARRPMLAVTPDGPMAAEVRRLNLGRVAPCDDPAAIARAIVAFYEEYRSGTLHLPDHPAIEDYSAPNLVSEFAGIAEAVCSGERRGDSELVGGAK